MNDEKQDVILIVLTHEAITCVLDLPRLPWLARQGYE